MLMDFQYTRLSTVIDYDVVTLQRRISIPTQICRLLMQFYANLFCKYLRNYLKARSGYADLRCKHRHLMF